MVLKAGEIVEAGKPGKGSTRDFRVDSTDSLKWLCVSSNEEQNKKMMEIETPKARPYFFLSPQMKKNEGRIKCVRGG